MSSTPKSVCLRQVSLVFVILWIVLATPTTLESTARIGAQKKPEIVQQSTTSDLPDYTVSPCGITAPQNTLPDLRNPSVTPTSGSANTSFTFEITYADADNDEPLPRSVLIDGQSFTMSKVTPGSNYVDGVLFRYQTCLTEGTHSYRFMFSDDGHNIVTTETFSLQVQPPRFVPSLFNGAMTPSTSHQEDDYLFTVVYQDIENNTPSYIRVIIDDSPHDMYPASGSIINYTNGVTYTYTVPPLSIGEHSYYFEAADNDGSVRLPITGSYTGPTVVYMTTYLNNPSLNPSTGDLETTFEFKIDYVSQENTTPVAVMININGSYHVMNQTDPEAIDYTNGVEFHYSTNLSLGIYTHHFLALNGTSIMYPLAGEIYGPVILHSGVPPVLTRKLVSPSEGKIGDTFTFSLRYTSIDNLPPKYVRMFLGETPYAMESTNTSDTNFVDGVDFITSVVVCSKGTHQFYIETSDGFFTVRGPEYGSLEFLVSMSDSSEPTNTESEETTEERSTRGFSWFLLVFLITAVCLGRKQNRG